MGHLIDEYKRKKAIIGKTSIIYLIESNPEGVKMSAIEIFQIIGDSYNIRVYPFTIPLKNEKDLYENHGYGSGFGDLWVWSYFASLDKEVAEAKLTEESKRVYDKYLDPNRPPASEIIMPIG
jgi:hypothetical protein